MGLTYAHLRNRHPEHFSDYWRALRALMVGGRRLLSDDAAMSMLFPQHPHEEDDVYENRKRRAFHIPYPGEIVGDLVGQLAQDPPSAEAEPTPDTWYIEDFVGDVDRKGMTLLSYAQTMIREALTVRVAWALAELPAPPKPGAEPVPDNLAEQEKAGLLRAYVCPLSAEAVTDWEVDEDGELLWACVWKRTRPRLSPAASRTMIFDTFTFYDREGWTRYEVKYEENKPPKDGDEFNPVDGGPHSFGQVPLLRLELPEGVWAMDKLFGAARAHFQQRSAFSYAQVRGLFPILTAFLGPEMGGGGNVPSEAQQAPERAVSQTYGMGRVVVFGHEDKLTYTTPPSDVYQVAADDLTTLRDEMHRVCAAMASAIDNTPSAVGRSGESKAQDKSAKELVLMYLGTILGDHLGDMLKLVSVGRGDEELEWNVTGFRTFDQVTAKEATENAQLVINLDIPSPTFQRVFYSALAKRIVAQDATPEQLEDIQSEIESNISDEQFSELPPRNPLMDPANPQGLPPGAPGAGARPPAAGAKGSPVKPPKATKKPAKPGAKQPPVARA